MMRQKRPCVVLTFATTTAAMAMEKQCMEEGIPGRLIPVPREITAGCGLAWRMTKEEYDVFGKRLEAGGVPVEQRVFMELY